MKDRNVYPTVTSFELKDHYRKKFKLPSKEFYLLHDCYGDLAKYKKSFYSGENYVFSGGKNGRDWKTIKRTAELLPHINFVIIGPQKNTLGDSYPANIIYDYDIPSVKFQELVEKCTIVALPLETQAPAGIIVLLTAGLMSKPVVTTNNITMREYIKTGVNGILVEMNDSENFAKQIENIMFDADMQKEFGEKLCHTVQELATPSVYVDTLICLSRHIIANENSSN